MRVIKGGVRVGCFDDDTSWRSVKNRGEARDTYMLDISAWLLADASSSGIQHTGPDRMSMMKLKLFNALENHPSKVSFLLQFHKF